MSTIRNPLHKGGFRRHDKLRAALTYITGKAFLEAGLFDGNNTGTSFIDYFQSLTMKVYKWPRRLAAVLPGKLLILNGGQRRDRTADAGLFRAGSGLMFLKQTQPNPRPAHRAVTP